ncbi:hypothetical protein AX774_g5250 [Zancudomyces culisetae]|uniref:Uncharacterized protein n=1 Tax=Zancudomyces culisetae TaxID=1213189 RepID=A0A1R1PK12_ZANCU|nr:hypothetical protein AX774_g5250 [Zancudomyces culisetae]|eukprot:OMH81306.1 hypothetical protein AX774_g5250 [Zancudomyces culisetae]
MLVDFVNQELVSNSDKYKWIREIFKFTNDADDHMASKDWYVSIFNGFDERKFTISEYERQTNEFEAKLVAVGVLLPSENIFSKNIRLDYTKYKAKIILDKIRSEVLKPDFEEVQTKELTPNEYFSLLDNSNHSIKGFSDKFLTKIPPITISKAAFHLVQQCIELLSLEIRISDNNEISSDLSARLVSNDAEEQAGSLSPLPHTAFIKKSITTLFEIYTCLRYNYHYKNITKIGHLCVVYFNDMMYLTLFAEYLLSMDYLDPKAVKEKELIQLMTDSGKQVLELWLHKTCASEIKSIIDQIRGFDNIQSANSYKVSEIKTALKKVVYYISKTSSSINKALVTKEIHNLIVGYLLDLFLNCVIDELCKLNSIGARESEILNELLDFNNMVLGADVPGTDEFEINATYINSLEKYHQIIDILVLNMKDIVKRHKLGLLASVDSNTVHINIFNFEYFKDSCSIILAKKDGKEREKKEKSEETPDLATHGISRCVNQSASCAG